MAAIQISDNPRPRVEGRKDEENTGNLDITKAVGSEDIIAQEKMAAIHGINRPFFHIDVAAAVESALANVTDKVVNVPN